MGPEGLAFVGTTPPPPPPRNSFDECSLPSRGGCSFEDLCHQSEWQEPSTMQQKIKHDALKARREEVPTEPCPE